eukprot:CAMPEP_0167757546 /NCGR_PEP_ID=MMETSP0110_2-20121227/9983_1 /TAXON_ID=629695 /ORGANISM="Gymnochlora sp., Strain CCMP2014" /LENGTH=194 /DNA_ID=CAMNT_0007643743 /DNA_START=151 /DNA_END=732 /DNA_ORIENTATION=-
MIIGNHRSTLDFSVGALVAAHAQSIGCGRMMPLMKDVLKWVPAVGWICYLSGALFLRRKWETDKAKIIAKVNEMVIHYPRPFWLGLYPEGTRFSEKKRDDAHKFAKTANAEGKYPYKIPILNNTLLPRPKGFIFFAQHERLRMCLDDLLDFTIGETGGNLSLKQFIAGGFRTKSFHIYRRDMNIPNCQRTRLNW